MPGRYISARLSRFEERLITTMARRERVTVSQMVRECIIREATRPLFGGPPVAEGEPPAEPCGCGPERASPERTTGGVL